VKGVPLKLRVFGVLVILRHPWRAFVAWGRLHGWTRTKATLYCPGCGYRTRRLPKARAHECEQLNRKAKRRMARAASKEGTVIV